VQALTAGQTEPLDVQLAASGFRKEQVAELDRYILEQRLLEEDEEESDEGGKEGSSVDDDDVSASDDEIRGSGDDVSVPDDVGEGRGEQDGEAETGDRGKSAASIGPQEITESSGRGQSENRVGSRETMDGCGHGQSETGVDSRAPAEEPQHKDDKGSPGQGHDAVSAGAGQCVDEQSWGSCLAAAHAASQIGRLGIADDALTKTSK
jgi:hypothetical protein